jgi:ABC-type branched-subunit amino acid transport system ATPase component
MSTVALKLEGITSGYRSSVVLRNLSLDIQSGETVALLGKNGMGKSTLLKSVMGFLPKKTGSIYLQGEEITRFAPQALFADLTIKDNLGLGLPTKVLFEERFAAIEPLFPVFKSRLQQLAGTLSGGEKKMLLLARTLMMRPTIIVLDEITEGLQPSVIDRLANALIKERELHATTMLIVEQNVPFALQVADRYVILKQGELIDEGDAKAPGAEETVFSHLRV